MLGCLAVSHLTCSAFTEDMFGGLKQGITYLRKIFTSTNKEMECKNMDCVLLL